ncbi:hypothetical protein AB8B21_05745 [Tardiphaga sp. 866_E4_N2_1]|uniref:hypothetical protein n=1 Tax=unclassified Tardiphaga TaxID=2631404 RepID=UPI003F27003C
MVDAWPAELPQCLNIGYSEGEGDGILEYKPDAGVSITRLRTSAVVRPLSGQIKVERSQLAILRQFFNVTLIKGALPFNFPDPTVLGETLLVRFPKGSQISWQQIGGGTYRVPISLEVLP